VAAPRARRCHRAIGLGPPAARDEKLKQLKASRSCGGAKQAPGRTGGRRDHSSPAEGQSGGKAGGGGGVVVDARCRGRGKIQGRLVACRAQDRMPLPGHMAWHQMEVPGVGALGNGAPAARQDVAPRKRMSAGNRTPKGRWCCWRSGALRGNENIEQTCPRPRITGSLDPGWLGLKRTSKPGIWRQPANGRGGTMVPSAARRHPALVKLNWAGGWPAS